MSDAKRLDVALTLRGLTPSRAKAAALISSGCVVVNGKVCPKSSQSVMETDTIEITQQERFVSRGGYKLLQAIEMFSIDLQDRLCMDVGASTGGFTDCMLQFGAKKVYAVDVGTDQLAEKLRKDDRVVSKEQCNFRYATREDIPDLIDFASVDVSFISLNKILPTLYGLLAPNGSAVCLIKPQFEAGKENLSKAGVVRNANVHIRVISGVLDDIKSVGFIPLGLTFSPITGPKGNIEYLVYITKDTTCCVGAVDPRRVVETAHKELGDKG